MTEAGYRAMRSAPWLPALLEDVFGHPGREEMRSIYHRFGLTPPGEEPTQPPGTARSS